MTFKETIRVIENYQRAIVNECRIATRNIVADSREQVIKYLCRNGYTCADRDNRLYWKKEIKGFDQYVYTVDTWA